MTTPPKKKIIRKKPEGVRTKKPSTVRERKLKRRDKAATAAEQKAKDDKAASSKHWEGGRVDQLLLRKAMNKRWGTDMTSADVEKILRSGDANLRDLAMAIIRKGMLFRSEKTIDEARVNQLAVGNLLRAEQQNQADEHKLEPDKVDLTLTSSPEERVSGVLKRLEEEMARRGISLEGRKNPSPNGRKIAVVKE